MPQNSKNSLKIAKFIETTVQILKTFLGGDIFFLFVSSTLYLAQLVFLWFLYNSIFDVKLSAVVRKIQEIYWKSVFLTFLLKMTSLFKLNFFKIMTPSQKCYSNFCLTF